MRNAVFAIIFVLGSIQLWEVSAQTSRPPNIIFILADDLGWSSLSCSMDKRLNARSDFHDTPNLARLANEGMRFSRYYASASICSPSRRSILFGQTPARHGEETFPDRYNPATSPHRPLPAVLKSIDSRYKAAHFGKWDMRAKFFPEDAGYDESDGNTGNFHGDLMTDKNDKWTDHFVTGDPKKMYSITGRAINFITRQARAGNPFYLQISHYATHVDLQARKETYEHYKSKSPGKKDSDYAFAAMLADLDHSIGLLLEEIDRLGLRDNTYIFFATDNGATEFLPPVRNRLDHPSSFKSPMRNHPLRGGKWTLYEGGIRVPMIVRGPGVKADSQCDIAVTGWDLLPTFAQLAGGGTLQKDVLDGGSFVGLLHEEGRGQVQRPTRELIFHRYNNSYPHSALIDGDHKIIKFWKTGKVELYNLASDPGEEKDISSRNRKLTNDLESRLIEYLNRVNPHLIGSYQK
jgi:arylsulfatase A